MNRNLLALLALLFAGSICRANEPFFIQVLDADTGRGVPLVELETVHHLNFVTDNSGLAAIDKPELFGQKVYFHVRSHGYEFEKDGFGYRGQQLLIEPGGKAELKIVRINIAERLYRITGGGLWADTIQAGLKAPIEEPLLNSKILGSDSAHNAEFDGKLFWIWGDTNRIGYPLGNFQVTAATSALKFDPGTGINLSYFRDERGFAKKMAPIPGEGPTWLDALVTLTDSAGKKRLVATYAKVKPPLTIYETGLCEYDPIDELFKPVLKLPKDAKNVPVGHPFRHEGQLYFGNGLPDLRMPDHYESWLNPATWEPLEVETELQDANNEARVKIHRGAVAWSPFRERWIFIATQAGGDASALGEIWYTEATSLQGPWSKAVQVLTHDNYSFYNPFQHPEFSRGDGRYLYFEGTYTKTFSGNPVATPRYDYNQILYRLDLSDPRLVPTD